MVLVDTSVWIDHLHQSDAELRDLLGRSAVVQHSMVIGELALGSIADRREVLDALNGLPALQQVSHTEVMTLVEAHSLYGAGLSLVDAHLLASVMVAPGTTLWTRDRRLRSAAERLKVAHSAR